MKMNKSSNYMFRAECAADAHAIRGVLYPWLMEWNERRKNIEYQGVLHAMSDVIVEFSIVAEGLCFGEMLWLVDGIDNAHVASETLARLRVIPANVYLEVRSRRLPRALVRRF
jgi:hypothetical protein